MPIGIQDRYDSRTQKKIIKCFSVKNIYPTGTKSDYRLIKEVAIATVLLAFAITHRQREALLFSQNL